MNDREDNHKKNRGITLVEVSMVIVVASLIVGSAITYKSLYSAYKLRSIITEVTRLKRGITDFKDKYFAYPGDMTLAFTYWGAACGGNSLAIDGGCNGDGDGAINWNAKEGVKGWQHMSLAGILGQQYDGTCTSALTPFCDSVAGINVPKSNFTGGVYYLQGDQTTNWRNAIGIAKEGRMGKSTSNLLKPKEALTLEIKLDDRLPGDGMVRALPFSMPCVTLPSIGGTGVMPRTYNIKYDEVACQLYFKISSF